MFNKKEYIEFRHLTKIPHGRLYNSEYPYYDGSEYYISTYGTIYRITLTNVYLASSKSGFYDKLIV